MNNCTYYPERGYHSVERAFNKIDTDTLGNICAFELNFHCLFNDFKNKVGDVKSNQQGKYELIDKGDWEDIFTDIIYDFKYSVTCRFSKGAYQFTISKNPVYGEEPKPIDDNLKHYIDDIIYRLEGVYDLKFEFLSMNSSPIKRLTLEEWNNCNLEEILDNKNIVIRLFYSSK